MSKSIYEVDILSASSHRVVHNQIISWLLCKQKKLITRSSYRAVCMCVTICRCSITITIPPKENTQNQHHDQFKKILKISIMISLRKYSKSGKMMISFDDRWSSVATPLAGQEGRQLDLCQDCRGMVSQVSLSYLVSGIWYNTSTKIVEVRSAR